MSSQEQMEIGKSCAYVATLFLGCFYTTLGQVQEFNFFSGYCFAKTIAPEQKTYQELNNLTDCNGEVAGIGAASGIAGAGIFFLSTLVLLGHLVLTYVGCQLINIACGRRHGYLILLQVCLTRAMIKWISHNDSVGYRFDMSVYCMCLLPICLMPCAASATMCDHVCPHSYQCKKMCEC